MLCLIKAMGRLARDVRSLVLTPGKYGSVSTSPNNKKPPQPLAVEVFGLATADEPS